MNIVNLTPHELNIYDEYGDLVQSILPSGIVARIETFKQYVNTQDGIPFFVTKAGEPLFLNEDGSEVVFVPDENHIYIVSGMFRQNYSHDDFYQPGELVRDNNGYVIGCVGLSQ